jgi:hypothetical protein
MYKFPTTATATIAVNDNNNQLINQSIFYFNVLTQQLKEPITDSAQV